MTRRGLCRVMEWPAALRGRSGRDHKHFAQGVEGRLYRVNAGGVDTVVVGEKNSDRVDSHRVVSSRLLFLWQEWNRRMVK